MAASEQARRTVIRNCKYRPIARIIQHKKANGAIVRFVADPAVDLVWLTERAEGLRNAIADDDFDRSVLDNNADYIDSFIAALERMKFPKADYASPQDASASMQIEGVKVAVDVRFSLQRITKTNKVKVGAGALRYAKGKVLPEEVGLWQSAFMHGYLGVIHDPDDAKPDKALCITIDAFSGKVHAAPTDAVRRFNNMIAACATIAERWPNVAPPDGAIL
jgi:hypothetical protein